MVTELYQIELFKNNGPAFCTVQIDCKSADILQRPIDSTLLHNMISTFATQCPKTEFSTKKLCLRSPDMDRHCYYYKEDAAQAMPIEFTFDESETTSIPNLDFYMTEMQKPLEDKCFFFSKIDADIYVDFGCADGTLLNCIAEKKPNATYIGYDTSQPMLEIAKQKNPNILYFSKLDDVTHVLDDRKIDQKRSAFILSSVLHEIYSYSTEHDIDQFWTWTWDRDFDFVSIRDMVTTRDVDRIADPTAVDRVRQRADPDQLRDFENRWGSITQNRNLLHYLLKYRYTDNWVRENQENYLALSWDELQRRIPENYTIHYKDHQPLPFLRDQINNDFGVVLTDPTHLKLIVKKS